MKTFAVACVLASFLASLGRTDAVRYLPQFEDSAGRFLLAASPSAAVRNCGGHSYDSGTSVCVTVGEQQWLCPKTASCACPTDRLGLRPFDCYDPAKYYCSSQSTQWPRSGLMPGNGFSNAGTCSLEAPGAAPAFAPAPAFGI